MPVPSRHRRITRADLARPWLSVLRVVGISALVLAVTAASLATIEVWSLGHTIADNSVDISNGSTEPPVSIGAIEGAFNVLMVGADNTPDQSSFGEERDATLNDVNILVHIAADHKSGIVVSFPRDLMIDHPDCTDPTTGETYDAVDDEPLNSSFERGGLGCVVATISSLTGLDIPYAALFSFAGTVAMTDAVGGVSVCVTDAIDDPDSGLVLPAGQSVISGRTALAYLRDRHGVGDGSDLARISSQQAYMSSLIRTMTSSETLGNPAKLYALATAAASNVNLSTSLAGLDTMVTMALALKNIDLSQMVFVQYPNLEDPNDANKLIPNDDLATTLIQKIVNDQPIALDANALGDNAEVDPNAVVPTTPAPPASTADPADPAASAPPATAPEVVDGLKGTTASQATCSVAAG